MKIENIKMQIAKLSKIVKIDTGEYFFYHFIFFNLQFSFCIIYQRRFLASYGVKQ